MGDTPVTCTSVVLYKFQAVILDRCVALSIALSPVGFEPTIYRLEVCCIIQLCYGNKYRRWDSNPYWTDFKSVVSADWTTAVKRQKSILSSRIHTPNPIGPDYYQLPGSVLTLMPYTLISKNLIKGESDEKTGD